MELTNILGKKETTPQAERFLAIQIQEGIVKTAVWQIESGLSEVIGYGPIQEWTDEESLLVAADASLAQALSQFDFEPDRVVFGLPESWIKEDKISPNFQSFIKILIDKLELKPIGFVVITEAILEQLKKQEGIPPSIILLELHSTKVNVVLVKTGEVVGREEVGRSNDLGKDVEEGLARIDTDKLPARIMVINGDDPEAEQQLTSYPWQERLPFSHLPKVETPDTEFSIKAIALSGGTEAAKSLGIEVSSPPPPSQSDTSTGNFGFVLNQNPETQSETEPTDPDPQTILSDLSSPPKTRSKFKFPQFSLPNFHHYSLSFVKKNRLLIFILSPIIILGVFLSLFIASTRTKATIEILVQTKQIDKTFDIAIGDNPTSDLPIISASTDTIELSQSDTIDTTGEALVGDKASGSVTLYNKTDSEKTLTAGTVLTTDSNLKFTLDDSITIASSSSEVDSELREIITPGKADAKVTASSIGADSNIGTDISLSVDTYPKSSFEARTSSPFSGGTSRTVKAVSTEDREALLDKLTQLINSQAEEQLNSRSSDSKVVSQGLEIIKQSFSKAVDEEADQLSLDLQAEVKLLRFNQTDLEQLINQQLSADIPAGYAIDLKSSEIKIENPQTKDDLTTATVIIKANIIPNLTGQDYSSQLKGKTIFQSRDLIENVAGFKKVIFTINPKIPFFRNRLPSKADRITIIVKPQP